MKYMFWVLVTIAVVGIVWDVWANNTAAAHCKALGYDFGVANINSKYGFGNLVAICQNTTVEDIP